MTARALDLLRSDPNVSSEFRDALPDSILDRAARILPALVDDVQRDNVRLTEAQAYDARTEMRRLSALLDRHQLPASFDDILYALNDGAGLETESNATHIFVRFGGVRELVEGLFDLGAYVATVEPRLRKSIQNAMRVDEEHLTVLFKVEREEEEA